MIPFIITSAIAILIISLYVKSVCIKFGGIPRSISATFYAIKHKSWFRLAMWGTPMLLMPAILEISNPGTEWMAFLSLIGMIMVGCFPDYKNDKQQYNLHIAGATLAVLGSQAWVGFNQWISLLVWAIYLIYTIIWICTKKEGVFAYKLITSNPMFWIEISSVVAIVMTMVSAFI